MGQVPQNQVIAQLIQLEQFRELLEAMYKAAIARHEFSVRLALLFASVLKVRQSGRLAQLLADEASVEEIALISKTIVEVVVNSAYLQCAEDSEIDRYLHSDHRFDTRQTDRLRSQLSTRPPPTLLKRIKQDAVQAVLKIVSNDADLKWSKKTLSQRAELADMRSNSPVMQLLVTNTRNRAYSTAAGPFEALAPYLAVMGTMQIGRTEDRHTALADALFGVNLSLMTMILYLNSYLGLAMDDAIGTAVGTRKVLSEDAL